MFLTLSSEGGRRSLARLRSDGQHAGGKQRWGRPAVSGRLPLSPRPGRTAPLAGWSGSGRPRSHPGADSTRLGPGRRRPWPWQRLDGHPSGPGPPADAGLVSVRPSEGRVGGGGPAETLVSGPGDPHNGATRADCAPAPHREGLPPSLSCPFPASGGEMAGTVQGVPKAPTPTSPPESGSQQQRCPREHRVWGRPPSLALQLTFRLGAFAGL